MYHIKKDKRAQNSAALICRALFDCLKIKSFQDITITDIQKISFVSRSTFYRHFDRIDDILYWHCDQCFFEAFSNYLPLKTELHNEAYHFTQHFLNYWLTHNDILELLLSLNRLDIIYDCHRNNFKILIEKSPTIFNFSKEDYDYLIGIRSGIMVGILTSWIRGGKQQSIEELFSILQKQFNFMRTSNLFI